jgi:ATP adenylyltransferase
VSLDQLWAGWRAHYVATVTTPESSTTATPPSPHVAPDATSHADDDGAADCVFCRIIASPAPDEERYVVHTGSTAVALLNAYPYASGHLLVMPLRHVHEIGELEPHESQELWTTTTDAIAALEGAYAPDGLNVGANLGRAAGAGIPRHLHLHVLPRWIGDTNFMTTVASVRVMPEPLTDSWTKLRASWPG